MVGEGTKTHCHKSERLGHMDEERDTQVDFVAVRATSCVPAKRELPHRDRYLQGNGHLQAHSSRSSIGSASSGTRTSRKHSQIFAAPRVRHHEHCRHTNIQVRGVSHTMNQAEETQKFSRRCHSRDTPATQLTSARTARTVHQGHVHITALRDTVDEIRSEPDPQRAFSEQTVGIQAHLFLIDDEKVARLCLAWQQWEAHSSTRSRRTFFARQTLRTEFLVWRASELAKEWNTPLFVAQLDLYFQVVISITFVLFLASRKYDLNYFFTLFSNSKI